MDFFARFFLIEFFLIFGDYSVFWDCLGFFLDFLDFFGLFPKLLWLLLKVTEVTTDLQKLPKISLNSIKSVGQRPKPSAGARRKPAK